MVSTSPEISAGISVSQRWLLFPVCGLDYTLVITLLEALESEGEVTKQAFLDRMAEILALEEGAKLDEQTDLLGLEHYDSIALLSIMAMADEDFGTALTAADLETVTTVSSLMQKIGLEHFTQ